MKFQKILYTILTFLYRRIDFLSKSIHALVLAILRELAAIGVNEGVINLITEFRQNLAIQDWKFWGLRFLELVLFGGSWIFLIILIGILFVVSILKYKSKDFPVIKHHFSSQLRTIRDLIEGFQSVTSLKLLANIQRDIDDSYLSKYDRDELSAWAYHLNGLCRVDDKNIKNSFQNHIKSYLLKPDQVEYMERACVSYYHTEHKGRALELSLDILRLDGLNERASAIRLFTDPSFDLSMIPLPVRSGMTFKRLYVNYLLTHEENRESKSMEVVSADIVKRIIPQSIDFNNIDYWELIGRYSFYIGINEQPNTSVFVKEDYSNNESIKYSNRILSMVFDSISETELYKNYEVFKLATFYHLQTEYLLNDNSDSVTKTLKLFKDYLSKKEFSNQLGMAIFICLYQLHRYKDVLELTPILDRGTHIVYMMEFLALNELGRRVEAKQSIIDYLLRLDVVGDIEVNNLLSFADFLIHDKQDICEFYQSNIEIKHFEFSLHKSIVFCYFHRHLPEKTETILSSLAAIKTNYSKQGLELRYAILVILLTVKDFEAAATLIETFHDWKTEQPPLSIYTACLLGLRNNSAKLLDVLKFRRDNFPEEYLFSQEISIYLLADNASEIFQIASQARIKYPKNSNFDFYYIYLLFKLNKDSQLDLLLNEDLFKFSFNWKQKLLLAKICIEKGKKLLGLELFYQEVIRNGINSPVLKQNYFVLTAAIGNCEEIPWPEIVEIGTVVKIKANQEEILLAIDENSNNENWLVKHILGLRKGENVKVIDPITDKKFEVSVVSIFDKYTGLTAQIADEVDKSNFTGIGLRSIKFEESNFESIKEALIEEFGEVGDKDKIRKDEAFKKYYNRQISFTELVRSVSRDDVLEVYSHLTSKQSQGFQVIPIRDFNNVQIKEDSQFVIDFTSLHILIKISEDFVGRIKHKFVISQFAIELIENELAEAMVMQDDGMLVSITSAGIRPTLYPPGFKDYRVSTLKKILGWIKDNCETRMSLEKLDMLLHEPDLFKEGDPYYNYFIDTVFLSQGRVLLSDDWIHNKNFNSNYLTVSIEYYLQYFYESSFRRDILPILIQNHYVGIRLDAESILKEFKRPFYGGVNTFHYCLENLPFSVNHDTTVFNEVLDFIKAIYIEEMPIEFKKETSQMVLINVLKSYPNPLYLRNNLINEINTRFSLLQNYLIDVLDDFKVAFDIINRSNST